MIVIINGPCGIGKTSVAWELIGAFDRAVMLDGDYIGAVHPFEIYDKSRVVYLYQTLRHLVAFHSEQGNYHNFVIPYVFERPESLARLKAMLSEFDDAIYTFRLLASDDEIERRICARESDPDWHLARYKALVEIQEQAAARGDIGYPIDTTGLSVEEVAALIWKHVQDAIMLMPYDPRWPARYEAERRRVAAALGNLALQIYHVGSTSVPGLSAKPIIDLMVAVQDLKDAKAAVPLLRELGYQFVDAPENIDRRFFKKGMPRAYHLHMVEAGSETLRDHLDFRDALRDDPGFLDAYARLKDALAVCHANNRPAYSNGKDEFVQRVLKQWRERVSAR